LLIVLLAIQFRAEQGNFFTRGTAASLRKSRRSSWIWRSR